jgi:serine/threonine-protein kinase
MRSRYKASERVIRSQAFGPYQLVERIGVGSMGEVYRAVHRAGGRVVALKRLSPGATGSADAIATLEGEARLARLLDHPGIAKLADMGQVEGVHFIAYDYVDGRDLRAIRERILRGGPPSSRPRRTVTYDEARAAREVAAPLPIDVAIHIALRVAEALEHAHSLRGPDGAPLGLVHRDVSPSNVLVSFDGGVKLLDFGIARVEGRLVRTDTGQVKGTLGYMSPEQVRGDALDGRSDVYSLAVCLWEMVTGRRLFDAQKPNELAERILSGDLPTPRSAGAEITEALDEVIRKALARTLPGRYASAQRFHAELARQAGAEGLLADPVRVARYVRSLFPEVAAGVAASREESLDMADNKGGSDLDVFEGLAKKASRPTAPGLTPPPPQTRKSTLLGGLGPLPPPVAPPPSSKSVPPPPGSAAAPAVPPPPSKAAPPSLPPPVAPPKPAGTLPGILPAPLPPPAPPPPSTATPAPPSAATPKSVPPPPTPPPARGAFPPPGSTAPAAPFLPTPSAAGAGALPPPAPPPTSAKAPLPPPGALPPPVPPPEKGKAGKAAVDMDWDDEEESTHVYDKAEDGAAPHPPKKKVGAAAALLASSGGPAPAARAPAPVTAPALPPASVPPPPPVPETRRDESTAIRPRPVVPEQPSSGRIGIVLSAIALAVALGLAIYMLIPKRGQFKINVTAKNGASIGAVDIYIDGKKQCEATPCVVSELEPGAKAIKVIAPGFPPTDSAETVEAGKEKVVFVTLEAGGATPAPGPVAATGQATLRIGGTEGERNVHVIVDGTDRGPLPIELKDLAPGNHKVRFDGGDRYEKMERSFDVVGGEVKDLGEVRLKVLHGQIKIDLQTSGASVTLVRRGDKKVEKKVNDPDMLSARKPLDIDPGEGWKLIASKRGFDDFTDDLAFEDGMAERTIHISLNETGKPVAVVVPNPGPGPEKKEPEKKEPEKKEPEKKAPEGAGSGTATLNINSIPVSKVILDGKPLGSTPKVGVSVPAGSHTVVFIHPDLGKQSVSVTVKAGETKTAAVKFKQ